MKGRSAEGEFEAAGELDNNNTRYRSVAVILAAQKFSTLRKFSTLDAYRLI
ncbi:MULTISPECIES: hypothetical protein [Paenibacillus]|jgi:hypothetical protein|uniref:hypothetical protein n=1 Tax=Paenibacillus TaxID=44249 RepID=UPI000A85D378|nr:hypothetical protein [Paenibacillus sp. FSL P4-0081]